MGDDSKVLGVSFRGWLTLLIVGTVCFMALRAMEVKEPLYTLCTVAVGFYFGQKANAKTNGGSDEKVDSGSTASGGASPSKG